MTRWIKAELNTVDVHRDDSFISTIICTMHVHKVKKNVNLQEKTLSSFSLSLPSPRVIDDRIQYNVIRCKAQKYFISMKGGNANMADLSSASLSVYNIMHTRYVLCVCLYASSSSVTHLVFTKSSKHFCNNIASKNVFRDIAFVTRGRCLGKSGFSRGLPSSFPLSTERVTKEESE